MGGAGSIATQCGTQLVFVVAMTVTEECLEASFTLFSLSLLNHLHTEYIM